MHVHRSLRHVRARGGWRTAATPFLLIERSWPPNLTLPWLRISVLYNRPHAYESIRVNFYLYYIKIEAFHRISHVIFLIYVKSSLPPRTNAEHTWNIEGKYSNFSRCDVIDSFKNFMAVVGLISKLNTISLV